MKTFLKIVGGVVLVVVALIAVGVIWLMAKKPASRPASAEKDRGHAGAAWRAASTSSSTVADCLGCHSDHVIKFGVPVKPGTEGQGGFIFDKNIGFPGVVAAQNITPDAEFGLGNWTDGEIIRAMREGVDRKGDALFPMMPYQHFRSMSDEDAKSVVVYLRTLKPIHNGVPAKHIDFPVNFIVKFAPKPVDGAVAAPDPQRQRRVRQVPDHDRRLLRVPHAARRSQRARSPDKAFAGGWEMKGPWGRNFTANLTPAGTYMSHATKEEFIGRFKAFASMDASDGARGAGRPQHGHAVDRLRRHDRQRPRRDLRLPEDGEADREQGGDVPGREVDDAVSGLGWTSG